jgi:hypothetical protein
MIVPAKALAGAALLLSIVAPAGATASDVSGPEPVIGESVTAACAVAQGPVQGDAARDRTRRGVLGWLYRYTRNTDVERVGGSRLPGFLRSPLLGSLPGRQADCDAGPSLDGATTCAVVSLDPGADHARTVTVPLPQMGVTTPAGLADRIHEKLAIGEWVSLQTNRQETLRFDRRRIRYVEAKGCRKDA